MKLIFLLVGLIFVMPFVSAHSGLYHNYAGGGTGFYILLVLLIVSLVIYEKLGDVPLGLSILWTGILVPLYIVLFYPQNDEIVLGMVLGVVVIVIASFTFNYLIRREK